MANDLVSSLEKLRCLRRLSQSQVAQLLGVHAITYNRWVMEKSSPNKIDIAQISQLLIKLEEGLISI